MAKIKDYLSLVRFSHTLYAMPFAIMGFMIGFRSLPSIDMQVLSIHFLFFIICMVAGRSAAMSFNRIVDLKWDKLNQRTANREIPRGVISVQDATLFTIIAIIVFFTFAYLINSLFFFLSPIAIALVLLYSYTKRFTSLCHFVLGFCLSMAPVGGYVVVTNHIHLIAFTLSMLVLFWVAGFDIIYSLQDEEFDRSNNLFSIPAWLGRKKAIILSRVLHTISILLLPAIGLEFHFSKIYWIGAIIFAVILYYQQNLVRDDDISKVDIQYMTLNGVASILYATLSIIALFW
ncbi:MAG: UbiA-like polyprenyltransferase [Phycisphaerales bacterium]|nr:UbiA-like polyprenyltransferase [Phycisphaerales bacterium]